MELRNIYVAAEQAEAAATPAAPPPPPAPKPAANIKLRLRKTKVSPHEEYALRPGLVRPISDTLAALICYRKGRAEISPKGITITRTDIGGKRIYHHVDSRLCNDLSSRERKIFYVLNSLKPEVIHLLDDAGRYLESLPEKFQPHVLNAEEQRREYDDQKRQLNRVARHLQELHADDTADALAALAHNAAQMKGIVQVLGTASAAPAQAPAPSTLGDRIAAADHAIRSDRHTYDRTPAGATDRAAITRDVLTRRSKKVDCPF